MTSPNTSACHVVDGSPSKVAPRTVHSRTIGLPGPNIAAIPSPPLATNGPNPGMVFSKLVNMDNFTRKDETDQSALGRVFKAS